MPHVKEDIISYLKTWFYCTGFGRDRW